MSEELQAHSCLAEDQSGGVRGIPLSEEQAEQARAASEAAVSADAVGAPRVTRYYQAQAASRARRTKADIYLALIHTPEGGESGTLSVLNNGRAGFDWFLPESGNLYRCNDYYNYIAWQAGHWPTNQRSIGIEQGDYARRSGQFSDSHYRRLAHLCAYLAETLDLAIRRTRDRNSYGFISHADVTPGQRTDPGAGFLWDKLLDYTLDYRRGRTPGETPAPAKPPRTRADRIYFAARGSKDKAAADAAVAALKTVGSDKGYTTTDPASVNWAAERALAGKLGQYPFVVVGYPVWNSTLQAGVKSRMLRSGDEFYPPESSDCWDARGAGYEASLEMLSWRLSEVAEREGLDKARLLREYRENLA